MTGDDVKVAKVAGGLLSIDDDFGFANVTSLLAMHRLSIKAFQGLEREHRDTIHQLKGDVAKVTQELHRTQLAFSKELIELKKLIEQPKEMT